MWPEPWARGPHCVSSVADPSAPHGSQKSASSSQLQGHGASPFTVIQEAGQPLTYRDPHHGSSCHRQVALPAPQGRRRAPEVFSLSSVLGVERMGPALRRLNPAVTGGCHRARHRPSVYCRWAKGHPAGSQQCRCGATAAWLRWEHLPGTGHGARTQRGQGPGGTCDGSGQSAAAPRTQHCKEQSPRVRPVTFQAR